MDDRTNMKNISLDLNGASIVCLDINVCFSTNPISSDDRRYEHIVKFYI